MHVRCYLNAKHIGIDLHDTQNEALIRGLCAGMQWLFWILAVPCRESPEVGHCAEYILGRMGFLAGLLHPAL